MRARARITRISVIINFIKLSNKNTEINGGCHFFHTNLIIVFKPNEQIKNNLN